MRKIKNTGIYLERSEFQVHRNEERGWDFWDPDFQVILRSIEDCDKFFPRAVRPEGKSGGVMFSLGEGDSEKLCRSHRLRSKRLPLRVVNKFVLAMQKVREVVGDDPARLRTWDMMRLPDPDRQPERYRIYGPFWNRHLAILWGYDSSDEDGNKLPNMNVDESVQRLRSYADKYYGIKVFGILLLRMILLLVLLGCLACAGKYGLNRFEAHKAMLAAIPRCSICGEVLDGSICRNVCLTCGMHRIQIDKRGKKAMKSHVECEFCSQTKTLNRRSPVTMLPAGVVNEGDIVCFRAAKSGTFCSTDWMDVHADANRNVYYAWNHAGDYSVKWMPDDNDANSLEVEFTVHVRSRSRNVYEPARQASFVFERKYDDMGKLSEVLVRNCSFDDRTGKINDEFYISWRQNSEFLPFTNLTERKNSQMLALANDEEPRIVTLRMSSPDGFSSDFSLPLDLNRKCTFPQDEAISVNPPIAVVGETVLMQGHTWKFGMSDTLNVNLNGMHHVYEAPIDVIDCAFAKAGNVELTVADTSNGTSASCPCEVRTLASIGPRLLDLSPPSVKIGSEVVASDVSGMNDIVRSDIRWARNRDFISMRDGKSVQSFGVPGIYEVSIRLWKYDGTFVEETRNVNVVDDKWQVLLSVEPNPAYPGQNIILKDMSVIPPGGSVVSRDIRWYPDTEFNPLPGDRVHRTFRQSGNYKAVVRLLDSEGHFHYGQAGVTIAESGCATPIMRLSAYSIQPGQGVWITDLSHSSNDCEIVKREFRKDAFHVFEEMDARNVLVQYDEPGKYAPELKVTCKHGFQNVETAQVIVRAEKPAFAPEKELFEMHIQSQKMVAGGSMLELSCRVDSRNAENIAGDYNITYFTIGGCEAVARHGDEFVFHVLPGGVHEVILEIKYTDKSGQDCACQVNVPSVETELRIK